MSHIKRFTNEGGWLPVSDQGRAKLVEHLSRFIRDLPSLQALQVGLCHCHSGYGFRRKGLPAPNDSASCVNVVYDAYSNTHAACRDLLSLCATRGYLDKLTKCRVTLDHFSSVGPSVYYSADKMRQVLAHLKTIQSFEAKRLGVYPESITTPRTCLSKDNFAIQRPRHDEERPRQLHLVSNQGINPFEGGYDDGRYI